MQVHVKYNFDFFYLKRPKTHVYTRMYTFIHMHTCIHVLGNLKKSQNHKHPNPNNSCDKYFFYFIKRILG